MSDFLENKKQSMAILGFWDEVSKKTLREMGLINSDGDIIFKGEVIGTINHIGNEEKD